MAFLGDSKTPWLYQDNDYKPVKEALIYLKDNGIGEKFNGSLELQISQLPDFVRHLFWLTRCNAALPDFYYIDLGMNIVGTICKYGNLHIYTLNEAINSKFELALKQTRFEILEDGKCSDQFYKGSKINHRQTVI